MLALLLWHSSRGAVARLATEHRYGRRCVQVWRQLAAGLPHLYGTPSRRYPTASEARGTCLRRGRRGP